ncbi:MAG: methyltransferase domain-containing protein, partial [Dehalococcoidia bacterium]|nr:methyltransferase domain-containing protein [Dehalococcoidia bacterium]
PNGQPGDFNADTVASLRKAGFRAALTTSPGFPTSGGDPYALPRLTLDNTNNMGVFRLTVTGIRSMLSSRRPTTSRLPARTFFDTTAQSYAAGYEANTPEGHSFRERKRLTLEMLGDVGGRRVLDIGSGPGVITGELLAGGASVLAVDIAPAMIELLKEKFRHPRLEARLGDIEALDLPDRSCDIAVALGVLEYLDTDEKALGELRRVLRRGGQAVISFPNRWSPWRLWNRLLLAVFKLPWRAFQTLTGRQPHPVRHREYSIRNIRRLARQFGFELVEVAGYNLKLTLFPFDRLFPKLTIAAAQRLSGLARSGLKSLGTGYLVMLRKP